MESVAIPSDGSPFLFYVILNACQYLQFAGCGSCLAYVLWLLGAGMKFGKIQTVELR